MLAWPRRSWTILGWTPAARSRVAAVWRRSWKRMSGSSAARRIGLQLRRVRLLLRIGSPAVSVNTRPAAARCCRLASRVDDRETRRFPYESPAGASAYRRQGWGCSGSGGTDVGERRSVVLQRGTTEDCDVQSGAPRGRRFGRPPASLRDGPTAASSRRTAESSMTNGPELGAIISEAAGSTTA